MFMKKIVLWFVSACFLACSANIGFGSFVDEELSKSKGSGTCDILSFSVNFTSMEEGFGVIDSSVYPKKIKIKAPAGRNTADIPPLVPKIIHNGDAVFLENGTKILTTTAVDFSDSEKNPVRFIVQAQNSLIKQIYAVTIVSVDIQGLIIKGAPYKTVYKDGDIFNPDGLKVSGLYPGNNTLDLDPITDYTLDNTGTPVYSDGLPTKEISITITSTDDPTKQITFEIIVTNKELDYIEIVEDSSNPYIKDYIVLQSFNSDNFEVYAHFLGDEAGAPGVKISSYTLDWYTKNTSVGSKTITVTVNTKTTTFTVTFYGLAAVQVSITTFHNYTIQDQTLRLDYFTINGLYTNTADSSGDSYPYYGSGSGYTDIKSSTTNNFATIDRPTAGGATDVTFTGSDGIYTRSLQYSITFLSNKKEITLFSLPNPSGSTTPYAGSINQTAHTINIGVPTDYPFASNVPTITISDNATLPSPLPSWTVSGNTRIATYTVTAADGTTQPYFVTAVAASGSIQAFYFTNPSPIVGYFSSPTNINVVITYDAITGYTSPTVVFTGKSISSESVTITTSPATFINQPLTGFPRNYIVKGYDDVEVTYTVDFIIPEASSIVGSVLTYHTSISAAFAAVTSTSETTPDTITLLKDVQTTPSNLTLANGKCAVLTVPSGKTFTIPMTNSYSSLFNIDNGSLTIKAPASSSLIINGGSNAEYMNPLISISSNGRLTMESNVIIKNKKGGSPIANAGTFIMNGGAIQDNQVANGGAVFNSGNAAFTMNGGTIQNNTVTASGGAVNNNSNSAVFTMNGGTIQGNQATNTGGAVYNAGTFTMSAGIIQNNTTSSDGGAVNNNSSNATFIMSGGTIQGNQATNTGGAVYNAGTFTMSDGTIQNNSSSTNGGGAVNNTGTFTMSAGTIQGNQTTSNNRGGGAVSNTGTFTMSAGTIQNNGATGSPSYGGAVDNTGTFTMSGGTIQGNTVSASGKGKAIYNSGTFKLGGAVININNDVYLTGDSDSTYKNITVEANLSTAVSVTLQNYTIGRTVLSGTGTYVEDNYYLFVIPPATGPKYSIEKDGLLSGISTFYVSATGDNTNDGRSLEKPFKTLVKAVAMAKADSGAYTKRVFIDGELTGSTEGNVGKTDPTFLIENSPTTGTTFDIVGINSAQLIATHNKRVIDIMSSTSAVPIHIKNVTFYGGNDKSGAGLWIDGLYAVVTFSHVTVSNCSSDADGGGVYLTNAAQLTIEDSYSIISNSAIGKGGGVYVNSGTLMVSGDYAIYGNTAENTGGGIYVNSGAVIITGDGLIPPNSTVINNNFALTTPYAHIDFNDAATATVTVNSTLITSPY
jgi:hypothetical protein